MSSTPDALIYLLAGTLRGWRGAMVLDRKGPKPERMLKLYDIEASPYCRMVREVLTELDLEVLILPCPKGGRRFRQEAEAIGGKQQFPLLIDDNTNTILYESSDISNYLIKTYASKPERFKRLPRRLDLASLFVGSALMYRFGGITGLAAKPSKLPQKPLILYSFESSPYSKPVRARLCELELPYILRNTGKGKTTDIGPPMFRDKLFKGPKGTTPTRAWLEENTGKVQVPYLIDENTGVAMYESQDILNYLDLTYGS
ncbi:MAG: glutathione S-transferase N-terminal domain-containing protein [Burkholderiales bacterium]|jgi:glutathione S-transferase|nr:glutathione S-transferase N-terminal domain-containing protein [Burkholderiales bacterium]